VITIPPPDDTSEAEEHPLELILARNLVSILSLPAFLVDTQGRIAFFNEAAGEVVGRRLEEVGGMSRAEWNAQLGPFDDHGRPLPYDELPLTIAVREGRPAYARFHVRADSGMIEVEAGAVPLLGPDGYHGAMVVFWPVSTDGAR
jgi:PAS domain-containing protein